MAKKLSANAYAKHRGVTLRSVQDAIAAGRITAVKHGGSYEIDPVVADREWEENTKHEMRGGDENPRKGKAIQKDKDGETQTSKLQAARVLKEQQLARLKELEVEERLGNLISKQLVEHALAKFSAGARDALLNLPQRIAPELAAETDPHVVELKLLEELRLVMNEFTNATIKY